MPEQPEEIRRFLEHGPFAVVGASTNREKYGNKVLRCYLQNDLEVFPVHPKEDEIEGQACYASLAQLPKKVHALSLITPPAISAKVVDEAIELGIPNLWFQPGAEDADAIERARAAGVNVIANGPCLLVALGYRE